MESSNGREILNKISEIPNKAVDQHPYIPKKIHLVWVGGIVPQEDLAKIRQIASLAKKSDFEINLWVDNDMNYYKSLEKDSLNINAIPHLRLRNVNELLEKMRKDPFYKEESPFPQHTPYGKDAFTLTKRTNKKTAREIEKKADAIIDLMTTYSDQSIKTSESEDWFSDFFNWYDFCKEFVNESKLFIETYDSAKKDADLEDLFRTVKILLEELDSLTQAAEEAICKLPIESQESEQQAQSAIIYKTINGHQAFKQLTQLQLQHSEQQKAKIENKAEVKNTTKLNNFVTNIDSDLIGFCNKAVMSDWLRYEILYQEGGYYFDTDTGFFINDTSILIPDNPALGIIGHCTFEWTINDDGKVEFNDGQGGNDMIAAIPQHPAMRDAINISINNFNNLKKKRTSEPESQFILANTGYRLDEDTTQDDQRRFPFSTKPLRTRQSRRAILTIDKSAGPTVFVQSVSNHIESTIVGMTNEEKIAAIQSVSMKERGEKGEQVNTKAEQDSDHEEDKKPTMHSIANITVKSNSRQSWLRHLIRPKQGSFYSFDDLACTSRLFHRKDKNEKTEKNEKKDNKAKKQAVLPQPFSRNPR